MWKILNTILSNITMLALSLHEYYYVNVDIYLYLKVAADPLFSFIYFLPINVPLTFQTPPENWTEHRSCFTSVVHTEAALSHQWTLSYKPVSQGVMLMFLLFFYSLHTIAHPPQLHLFLTTVVFTKTPYFFRTQHSVFLPLISPKLNEIKQHYQLLLCASEFYCKHLQWKVPLFLPYVAGPHEKTN